MSAPSRRNMDRAVDDRQALIEASLPKCTTSGTLEKQLRETVRIFQDGGSPDFLMRQIESYWKLVNRLVAMYAAEIEHRKGMQS